MFYSEKMSRYLLYNITLKGVGKYLGISREGLLDAFVSEQMFRHQIRASFNFLDRFHLLHVTKRAIARIPAQISRAVGTICDAGNRNP